MTGIVHSLKTLPVYFQRTWEGEKTFEVRIDDRGFQRGDTLVLREWDHRVSCGCPNDHRDDCARYSGRTITARVGFVQASTPSRGNQRGWSGHGYVAMSLVDPQHHDGRATPASVFGRPASADEVLRTVAAIQRDREARA